MRSKEKKKKNSIVLLKQSQKYELFFYPTSKMTKYNSIRKRAYSLYSDYLLDTANHIIRMAAIEIKEPRNACDFRVLKGSNESFYRTKIRDC